MREEDYDLLAKDARTLADTLRQNPTSDTKAGAKAQFAKLKARADQVLAIDFFGANGREALDGLLGGLLKLVKDDATATATGTAPGLQRAHDLTGRTWSRARVSTSIGSLPGWLIRRFIDEKAAFKFVPAKGYVPEAGELRFDMFDAEFTHIGDRCTFEVLMLAAVLNDPALQAIAEIVHDIDLKDAKFGRERRYLGMAQ